MRSANALPDVNSVDTIGAFVPGPQVSLEPTAAGRLGGLTFAVKDLIDVAGHVTGGGNPDWLRTHEPAVRSAPVVDLLLAAGAKLSGKTVTDELAFSLEGVNGHYGTPLNLACPDRIPGGSSSGSGDTTTVPHVNPRRGTINVPRNVRNGRNTSRNPSWPAVVQRGVNTTN